ncbi:hypothetical protein BS78_01G074600 [Paspalum vaginatum]|nr:hypothetical protein BS78_01G074600 [Paspalum vaginatum]
MASTTFAATKFLFAHLDPTLRITPHRAEPTTNLSFSLLFASSSFLLRLPHFLPRRRPPRSPLPRRRPSLPSCLAAPSPLPRRGPVATAGVAEGAARGERAASLDLRSSPARRSSSPRRGRRRHAGGDARQGRQRASAGGKAGPAANGCARRG